MKKFKHVILTKFNTLPAGGSMLYDNPTAANLWMDKRMPLFKNTKESVLSQKGDFKWIISVDERTPGKYIDEIKTDDRIIITNREIMYSFEDYKPESDWVITSRIDNDDQYLPGFVEAIAASFEPKKMVIDVGFYALDWDKKKLYRHNKKWTISMFASLIEPSDRIATVFCRPHGEVNQYPKSGRFGNFSNFELLPAIKIEKTLALMVCHGANLTNKISGEYVCELKDI